MNIKPVFAGLACLALAAPVMRVREKGFVLEHEKDLAVSQPGPHRGGGTTTAYPFFSKVPGLELVFRKRVLHPGSAIGYHEQKEDEIYYVVQGKGMMLMNGDSFPVKIGDAILTRPGSSHGLRAVGGDLIIFIVYQQAAQTGAR